MKLKLTDTENLKLTQAAEEEQSTMKEFVAAQEKYTTARQHRIDIYEMVLASHNIDLASIVPGGNTNLEDGILVIPEIPKQEDIKLPAKKKRK